MKPSNVAAAVKVCLIANQPVMLHGSPGGGKSQVVKQVSKDMSTKDEPWGFKDVRLSQLDPVDLRGVPAVINGITTWNPPEFLPRTAADGGRDPDNGILFLDEINSAAQGTAAAAYQLVLDRELGDYKLPPGWRIVAAGNKSTDRALVNEMSTALRNRFTHIDYETNNEDWYNWAFDNNIHETVIGFVRFRPMHLNEFEQRSKSKEEQERLKNLKNAKAFATPRSWAFLSNLLQAKPSKDIEYDLIAGTVGEGIASEFMAYLKYYREMPDLDEILMNPKTAPVPDTSQPAVMFAVSTGLGARANADNFEAVTIYLDRIPKEYQALTVKDALARDKDRSIVKTNALQKWATKNSKVLI